MLLLTQGPHMILWLEATSPYNTIVTVSACHACQNGASSKRRVVTPAQKCKLGRQPERAESDTSRTMQTMQAMEKSAQ